MMILMNSLFQPNPLHWDERLMMFGRKRNELICNMLIELRKSNELRGLQLEMDGIRKTNELNELRLHGAMVGAIQGCHNALVEINNAIAEFVNRPTPDIEEVMGKATRGIKDALALMGAGAALGGKEEMSATGSLSDPTPEPTKGLVIRGDGKTHLRLESTVEIDDVAMTEKG